MQSAGCSYRRMKAAGDFKLLSADCISPFNRFNYIISVLFQLIECLSILQRIKKMQKIFQYQFPIKNIKVGNSFLGAIIDRVFIEN